MSKLKILDMKGLAVGEMAFDDGLAVDKGGRSVHDLVTAQLAGRRAGTASTKTKGEVAGSNKKPWKQKGTGRARAGCRRSPVWRGGGVAFGPNPRDYAKKVNKKVQKLAFRSVFVDKVAAGEVIVLDKLELVDGKTKGFVSILKALQIVGGVLFLVEGIEKNIELASRNVKDVEVCQAGDVDIYRIMKCGHVVITSAGMEIIQKRIGVDGGKAK